jgi:hypothetical protein
MQFRQNGSERWRRMARREELNSRKNALNKYQYIIAFHRIMKNDIFARLQGNLFGWDHRDPFTKKCLSFQNDQGRWRKFLNKFVVKYSGTTFVSWRTPNNDADPYRWNFYQMSPDSNFVQNRQRIRDCTFVVMVCVKWGNRVTVKFGRVYSLFAQRRQLHWKKCFCLRNVDRLS